LRQLAQKFCAGYTIDAAQFFGRRTLPRMALPTYPFARKIHWAQKIDLFPAGPLHPLVQQTIAGGFASRFTGQEFFLADHIVQGSEILPGVAYLEMAQAAVRAAGSPVADRPVTVLRNVSSVRPLVVDDAGK